MTGGEVVVGCVERKEGGRVGEERHAAGGRAGKAKTDPVKGSSVLGFVGFAFFFLLSGCEFLLSFSRPVLFFLSRHRPSWMGWDSCVHV